jgi:hypothetical protein
MSRSVADLICHLVSRNRRSVAVSAMRGTAEGSPRTNNRALPHAAARGGYDCGNHAMDARPAGLLIPPSDWRCRAAGAAGPSLALVPAAALTPGAAEHQGGNSSRTRRSMTAARAQEETRVPSG